MITTAAGMVVSGVFRTSASVAPLALDSGEVPIEMPDKRRIIVSGAINGAAARLMLDTGAGRIAIDSAFATGIGLRSRSTFVARDIAGESTGATSEAVAITIGTAHIDAANSALVDLSVMNAALPEPVQAIIGRDLFGRAGVWLDFDNRALRIGGVSSRLSQSIQVEADPAGLWTVDIAIGNRAPIRALIDIGADRPLYLSPDYAANEELLADVRTSLALSGGVGGIQLNTVAVLSGIKVGVTEFDQVPVEVPATWTFDVPAVIGLPIWRRFRAVEFDFPANRVLLPARDLPSDEPFRKDRSGLGVVFDGTGLRVLHVAPGSPAEQAHVGIGSTIVAVNDVRCDRAYLLAHGRDGAKPAGTILRLRMRDGSNTSLTLADYF